MHIVALYYRFMLYYADNSANHFSSTGPADLQSERVSLAQRQNHASDAFVSRGFSLYLFPLLHFYFGRRVRSRMVKRVFKVLHMFSDIFWRNASIFSLNWNYS